MKDLVFIVDIGNTAIAFAIFNGDELLATSKILTHESELDDIKNAVEKLVLEANVDASSFKGGLISSVVPNISRLVQIAVQSVINFEIPIMDQSFNSLVKMRVDNNDEVGGDLRADVIGATSTYKSPILIVDLGTITKFLLIDETGTFIKTNFFPGIGLCREMMSEKTSLLPKINESDRIPPFMGTNTIDAMEGGLYYGHVNMIVGYENKLKEEYKNITLVLTGGYGEVLQKSLPNFIYDKDLTLKGILALYRKGVKNGL